MRIVLWAILILIAGFTGFINQTVPYLSWWICWGTSVVIYLITIFGILIPLPQDKPIFEQMFRPYFLAFTFFSGYVPISPIFHFVDLHGFEFLDQIAEMSPDSQTLLLVSKAQWFYLLAHIAYVGGMGIIKADFSRQPMLQTNRSITDLLIQIFLFVQVITVITLFVPGLVQIAIKVSTIGNFIGAIFLGVAWKERNKPKIIIGLVVFAYIFVTSLFSGMKSAPLFVAIVLFTFLVQEYPKTITLAGGAIFIAWLLYIPYYNGVYRHLAWSQGVNPVVANEIARTETMEATPEELRTASWSMLTDRLSEVGMFIKYLSVVPDYSPYYGGQIILQSIQALIPRVFWEDKPDMEVLIMQRVLDSGVVEEYSQVSAKPAFIVDAYLTGGWPVIIIAFFLLGSVNILLSKMAEYWFGGYLLGTGIIYNGLFQIVWLGNSFEFLVNVLFWSFVIMFALRIAFVNFGLLKPTSPFPEQETGSQGVFLVDR